QASDGPRCAAALSTDADTTKAVREACAQVGARLGTVPDLAVLFVSPHHVPKLEDVAGGVGDALGTETLVGCTGESIVGSGQEIEDAPALSLWITTLPGVSVTTMHLEFARTSEGGTFVGWPDDFDALAVGANLLVLGEPFSF